MFIAERVVSRIRHLHRAFPRAGLVGTQFVLSRYPARLPSGRPVGGSPYGTSFDTVAERVPDASIHTLDGQGHLAHLEAPAQLAALVGALLQPEAP